MTVARHTVRNGPTKDLGSAWFAAVAALPSRETPTPAAPVPARPVDQAAAWRLAVDRAEARADRAVAIAVFAVGLLVIVAGVWAAVRLFL